MTHKNGIKLKKIIMNYSNLLTMQRYTKKLRKPNYSQNILNERQHFHNITVY